MTVAYACACVWLRVGISGLNSFKGEKNSNIAKSGKKLICRNSPKNSGIFKDLE